MSDSESPQDVSESFSNRAERDFARRQQLTLGFLIVFVPVLIYFSVLVIKMAKEVHSSAMSFPLLLTLCLFVLLVLYLLFTLLRRKWTTGRLIMTRAEAMAKQDAMWNKLGAGKPLRPQIWFVMFPIILLAVLAAMAAAPIYVLRHLGGRPPQALSFLIVALFATILSLPAWYLYKTIRRKVKTGSFLLSQEEVAKARARTRKPVPLRSSILTASSMWMLAGVMASTQISDYRHLRTPEMYRWGMVAFALGASCLWIWQVFRPFKPHFALPEEQQEPQEKSMGTGKRVALLLLGLAVASILPVITIFSTPRYRVIYPAASDARAELASALQSAAQSHKRVLVEFGANTDGDSQALDRYLHDKSNLALLESGFVPVLVNTDAHGGGYCACDANKDLASQYAISFDKGIPALAVLSEKGELIYSQRNGEFAEMRHLKSSDLTAFLQRWEPAAPSERSTP